MGAPKKPPDFAHYVSPNVYDGVRVVSDPVEKTRLIERVKDAAARARDPGAPPRPRDADAAE